MLKSFLLFLLFFWSSFLFTNPTFAHPVDVSGEWSFRGKIESAFKKEQVLQMIRNSKDEARLRELKSQGYTCVYKQRQTYRCVRVMNESWKPSKAHQEKVADLLKGKDFEIVKTPGEPALITSGESAKQWSLPALAYNEQGKTNSVIYWELDGGLNKLQFEINDQAYWPFFTSPEKLNLVVVVTESHGNRQTLYYYDAVFTKN